MENGEGLQGSQTPLLSLGLHPFSLRWPSVGLLWTSTTQQALALELEVADLEGKPDS